MKVLSVETEDLREICATMGVDIEEALAARQHRRMFTRALDDHPRGTAINASEVLNVLEISTSNALNQAAPTTIEG